MSPLLGSIGGISEYAYRGNLDDYANDFSFTNISNAEPGIAYTSGITTITGINYKIRVSVGAGGSFSVNGGAFSTSPQFIRSGDQISLSLITTKVGLATDFSRENNLNITVGKRNTTWTVTTRAKNDNLTPFTFTSLSNFPVGVATTSSTVSIVGLETGYSVPVSVTGFGASISINSGSLSTSGNVLNGDNFYVYNQIASATEQSSYNQTRTISVTVGTYTTTWSIVTESADLTPDAFSFTNVTGAEINTTYTSNSITVAGINSVTVPKFTVPISIAGTGFEYSVNAGIYTTTTGTVVFGDTVALKRTTSSGYATTTTGTLTIGGISTSWSITTKAQPFDTVPDAFSFNSVSSASLGTQYESNSITLSGMTAGFSGTASITGGAEFKVTRSGSIVKSYSTSSTSVQLGDVITLRRTSSSSYGTTLSSTFTVSGTELNGNPGTTSASWSITTQSAPAPPPPPPPPCVNQRFTSLYVDGYDNAYVIWSGGTRSATGRFADAADPGAYSIPVTSGGGLRTTEGSLADYIVNYYKTNLRRLVDDSGFGSWRLAFITNSKYTSFSILGADIQAAYNANERFLGTPTTYGSCGTVVY